LNKYFVIQLFILKMNNIWLVSKKCHINFKDILKITFEKNIINIIILHPTTKIQQNIKICKLKEKDDFKKIYRFIYPFY
jgi:hypothetical protein